MADCVKLQLLGADSRLTMADQLLEQSYLRFPTVPGGGRHSHSGL